MSSLFLRPTSECLSLLVLMTESLLASQSGSFKRVRNLNRLRGRSASKKCKRKEKEIANRFWLEDIFVFKKMAFQNDNILGQRKKKLQKRQTFTYILHMRRPLDEILQNHSKLRKKS